MATGQEKIRWRDFIIEIIILLLITISIVLFFVFFFSPSIILECIIIIILTVTIIEIILIRWKLKDFGSLRSFTIYNFAVGILTSLSLSFILIFMGISPIPTLIIHKIIYIPTIIDTYLSAYWIQHCYGIKYYWLFIYINKSFVNESIVQYFNKSGLPFNNITIKQVQDLLSYTYVYYPVMLLGSLLTFILGIIIVAILILPCHFFTLKDIAGKYDNIREDLCDNGILFRIHFLKSFIIYLIIFWIIVYSSLAFLITSEYPYAYLVLITTFLVIIIEVFVLRESEISDIAYTVLMYLLFVGVVATGFFTMLVFYLSSVFLPSTCLLIASHSVVSVLKNIKSIKFIYTVLLAFASILGALPYASTLWIVQYRYECSHQRKRQTDTRWFCA